MMNLRSYAFACAALAFYGLGAASSMAASPAGRFCGELISSGNYRDVETILNITKDGQIFGKYEFQESNGAVQGTLTEKGTGTGTSRTLIWHDKYGTGLLDLHFSNDFRSFQGLWGDAVQERHEAPSHSWDGSRCHDLTA
jgi:hypothetical protein